MEEPRKKGQKHALFMNIHLNDSKQGFVEALLRRIIILNKWLKGGACLNTKLMFSLQAFSISF
jgi:hypothetical protein